MISIVQKVGRPVCVFVFWCINVQARVVKSWDCKNGEDARAFSCAFRLNSPPWLLRGERSCSGHLDDVVDGRDAAGLGGRRGGSIGRVCGEASVGDGGAGLAFGLGVELVALDVVEDAGGLELADSVDVFPHLFGTNGTGWVLTICNWRGVVGCHGGGEGNSKFFG